MAELTLSDHNHNLKYNLIHEFSWGFGVTFHTLYAIVPLFLKQLGAPDSVIVATAGLFSIVIAVPTLFTAAAVRNIKNIKKAVIAAHAPILIISFLMGFTFSFLDSEITKTAWKIYFFYFIIYAFSIGIIVPIWADFLNQSTIKKERGKFFGLGFAFNSLGSFIGGIALSYLLSLELPFPKNFGVGFFLLFISLTIGTILFLPFKINSISNAKKHKSVKSFIYEAQAIILKHKNFQKYILSRVFFSLYLPGMGLYAAYCQDKFNFDFSEVGIFTILNVIAAGFASYLSGWLGDNFGHKSSMLLSYFGHLIAVILAIFASNMVWVYGIFIAIGIGQGAFLPSAMNLVYDFAGERDTKTYLALIDTLLAPFIFLFITVIGKLVQSGLYQTSFYIIAIGLSISILILHFSVKDPKLIDKTSFHLDGFSP